MGGRPTRTCVCVVGYGVSQEFHNDFHPKERQIDKVRVNRPRFSVVDVARSLGHDIVAEGIETDSQLLAVKLAGASCGQGFLLAKPMPIPELADYAISDSTASQTLLSSPATSGN